MAPTVHLLVTLGFILTLASLVQSRPNADEEVTPNPVTESEPEPTETTTVAPPIMKELVTGKRVDVTQHRNVQLLPTVQECGFISKDDLASNSKSGTRIFSSRSTISMKYPWIARIIVEGINLQVLNSKGVRNMGCAGTLISSQYVLTTATCLAGLNTGNKVSNVILGGQGTNCENGKCSPVSKIFEVQETIVHPDFVLPTRENDIGIIRLKKDVLSENFIRPICLPQSENLLRNWKTNKMAVVGWTKTDESHMLYPRNLQSMPMTLELRDYCDRFYKRSNAKFGPGRFCASGGAEKASCTEDEGGPALKSIHLPDLGQNRAFQIGIVSFQHKLCGQPGIPNGFINVINYMPWILDNLSLE